MSLTEHAHAISIHEWYRRARLAAWLGLWVNIGLAIVKLFAGLAGQSIALIADAINSLGDGFSSGAIIYALGIAQRPADEEHPYGHSRAEAVAALSVAVLLGASAVWIAVEAIRGLNSEHLVPPVWTLWIAGANVLIKEGMYQYKRRVALSTGSQSLAAGAWDHRSDALCSLAVLIGLALVRFGGEMFIMADEIAALVVVCFILVAATKLYRRNASMLMDEQADAKLLTMIESEASLVSGVEAIETLRARRSGIEAFVDIHIEVDGNLSVDQGHDIAHEVKRRLISKLTPVADVLVHVEPTRSHRNTR